MEDDGGHSVTGNNYKVEAKSGPNHRRGERSDLVKTWMMKNDKHATDPSKSRELKMQYAEALKIRREDFWATMKTYALRSKEGMLPDFEQIIHHMKDDSRMDLADLKMGDTALEYWWQLDTDKKHYRPVTDNLKNFKPSSGLLHHFYNVFIYNPTTCDELFAHSNRLGSSRWKHAPNDLLVMIEKEDPFRSLREPKALLVLPRRNPALRGTYALSKKLNGNFIYIRPQRAPVQVDAVRASVEVNDVAVHIPLERMLNYSTVENALILYCKEEKRHNGEASDASYRNVKMRLKVPQSQSRPLEAEVPSLRDPSFDTPDAVLYPVRDLEVPYQIADELDYGAVWAGVFSPFARPSVSVEELAVHFPSLAQEVFKYVFSIGDGDVSSGGVNMTTTHSNQQIEAEAYIRLMTWFSAFDQGFGPDACNLLGLWQSLASERMPFSILSKSEVMQANRDIGAYCLRLGTSKIGYLVFEVLVGEEEVLCCRVKLSFQRPQVSPHQLHPPSTVIYELEGADGSVICREQNSLRRTILAKVRELCPLPPPHVLHSYTKPHQPPRPQPPPSTHVPSASPPSVTHKRKRDPLPPSMGPPELAGFDRVPGTAPAPAPPPPAATLHMWGQQIAMPDFTRGHSLNPHPSASLSAPQLLGVMQPPYASSYASSAALALSSSPDLPPPVRQASASGLSELGGIPVFQSGEMVGRQHSIGALSDLLMGDFELSLDTQEEEDGGSSRAVSLSLGPLDDLSHFHDNHNDTQQDLNPST